MLNYFKNLAQDTAGAVNLRRNEGGKRGNSYAQKNSFSNGGIKSKAGGGRKSYWASPMTARQALSFEELPKVAKSVQKVTFLALR